MKFKKIYIYLFISLFVILGIFSYINYKEQFENDSNSNYDQVLENNVNVNNNNSQSQSQMEPFINSVQGLGNFLTDQFPNIYDSPYRYPNATMPPAVISCGGRRGGCMGGSEIPIPNTIPPVNISDANIAPVNLTVRGFDEGIQQVGTIQQVFSNDNFVYPLFGRKRYRNDNQWEYFVKFGQYGVILPVVPLRNYEELNTNDEVFIQGQKHKYRVTMYDEDIPQYLPFS